MLARRLTRALLVLAVAVTVPLAAQGTFIVKLATLAPDNSPWTGALRSMGQAWEKATARRVRLTVFAGTIPSESSALDRMALDNFQAATLSAAGVSEIDEAFNVFGIPFFFQSDEELAHVQAQLTPMFAKRLEAKKFHLLSWGNAGWVQVFSKRPIRTLADLKNAKLYTGTGSPKMERWYTSNGFHAVPLEVSEIPKQLKVPTGQIDTAPSPPVFALTLQFFRDAPNMLDLRVAPLTSVTIMTESAWNRIPAEDRPKIVQAAKDMETRVNSEAPGLDAKAIEQMKTAGLNVITLDAEAKAAFQKAAESLLKTQRGDMVPADVFDEAVRARDAISVKRRG